MGKPRIRTADVLFVVICDDEATTHLTTGTTLRSRL